MLLALLLLIFIVLPIAELYVILQVGDTIGALPTVLLLVADSVLGALLLRTQGRTVWRRFNTAVGEGRMPHRELQDGVAVIFGGAFLITPGFITDVIGLLLLIPPTRAIIRRLAMRSISKRFWIRITGMGAGAAGAAAGRRGDDPRNGDTVEGTATEYEDLPPLPRQVEP